MAKCPFGSPDIIEYWRLPKELLDPSGSLAVTSATDVPTAAVSGLVTSNVPLNVGAPSLTSVTKTLTITVVEREESLTTTVTVWVVAVS